MTNMPRAFVVSGALALAVWAAGARAAPAAAALQATQADLVVDVGTVSNPPRGNWLSFQVADRDPDEATNVTFRMQTRAELCSCGTSTAVAWAR